MMCASGAWLKGSFLYVLRSPDCVQGARLGWAERDSEPAIKKKEMGSHQYEKKYIAAPVANNTITENE